MDNKTKAVKDVLIEHAEFKIEKFDEDGNKIGESSFEGNSLVDEGINELTTLFCSSGGTLFDNTNASLGVGTSSVATTSGMTALQGATTTFSTMDSGFPTYGSNQQAVWQATFGDSTANHSWQEFCVVNGADDTSTWLNRAISDQSTKASGQTWQLTLTITFS